MNRLLAFGLTFVSTLAVAENKVLTCSLANNKSLQDKFRNRSFDGFFRSNDSNTQVKTVVTFTANGGQFKRPGQSTPDSLSCIRYLTVAEAFNLSQQKNASAIDVGTYFDTSTCEAAILADWSVNNSRGRVLWCAPLPSSGAAVKGVYWQDDNWTKAKFTGVWEGLWK